METCEELTKNKNKLQITIVRSDRIQTWSVGYDTSTMFSKTQTIDFTIQAYLTDKIK